jgi:hypothetical protein
MKKTAFILGLLLLQGFGGTGGDFNHVSAVPGKELRGEIQRTSERAPAQQWKQGHEFLEIARMHDRGPSREGIVR